MSRQQESKYDMRINPVYQVDWSNQASGKRVSATKRRVRWRFGFSNANAIAAGAVGTECRGEEHEVTLIWSLTSGKRIVLADGKEVHFSAGKVTDSKFETSWTMPGGHIMKLEAHTAPPLRYTPGFRQFDLRLDGCSFFDMPKIYELGRAERIRRGTVPSTHDSFKSNNRSVEHHHDHDFSRRSQPDLPRCITPEGSHRPEPEYNRRAITGRQPPRDVAHATDRSPQSSAPRQIDATPTKIDLVSDSFAVEDLLSTPTTGDEVHQDEFTPVQAQEPPKSFALLSNQILSAYTPESSHGTLLALANESHTYSVPVPPQPPQGYYPHQTQHQAHYQEPQQSSYQQPVHQNFLLQQPQQSPQQQLTYRQQQSCYQQQHVSVTPDQSVAGTRATTSKEIIPSMKPLSLQELEEREQPQLSEMERAMRALVNLDDITETKATPEQAKATERKLANMPVKGNPLPPAAPEWHLGVKPAIGDIQKHKVARESSKEIMRTHAFDPRAVHAGMMVLYGQTIPQVQGFGAGYGQQQKHFYSQAHQQQYAAY